LLASTAVSFNKSTRALTQYVAPGYRLNILISSALTARQIPECNRIVMNPLNRS
jgi:hypothetical protein